MSNWFGKDSSVKDLSKDPAIKAAVDSAKGVEPTKRVLSPTAKEQIQSIEYLGSKLDDFFKTLGSSPSLSLARMALQDAIEKGTAHVHLYDADG